MHHLVGHDSAISADGTTRGRHHVESKWRGFRAPRLATLRTALDRDGHARKHSFDARALGRVPLAQPLSIPRTGQAFTPATASPNSCRRGSWSLPGKIPGRSI